MGRLDVMLQALCSSLYLGIVLGGIHLQSGNQICHILFHFLFYQIVDELGQFAGSLLHGCVAAGGEEVAGTYATTAACVCCLSVFINITTLRAALYL